MVRYDKCNREKVPVEALKALMRFKGCVIVMYTRRQTHVDATQI